MRELPTVVEEFFFDDRAGRLQLSFQRIHPVHGVMTFLENPTTEVDYQLLIEAAQRHHAALKCSCVSQEEQRLVIALLKQGFVCKRHCYEGTVLMKNLKRREGFPEARIQSLSQLSSSQRAIMEEQLAKDYRRYHAAVSPVDSQISSQDLAWIMLNQAASATSYTQFDDDDVRYFITELVGEATVFVTYAGGAGTEEQLLSFYEACFARLAQAAIVQFEYEIEDTNPTQWLLQHFFELEGSSYDAYIYEV